MATEHFWRNTRHGQAESAQILCEAGADHIHSFECLQVSFLIDLNCPLSIQISAGFFEFVRVVFFFPGGGAAGRGALCGMVSRALLPLRMLLQWLQGMLENETPSLPWDKWIKKINALSTLHTAFCPCLVFNLDYSN